MIKHIFYPGRYNPRTQQAEVSPFATHRLLRTPARYCVEGESVPEAYVSKGGEQAALNLARDWEIAISDDKRMWRKHERGAPRG